MGPTIKYLFFWNVSSNKLDRARGVEECRFSTENLSWPPLRRLYLKVQQSEVKLIYREMDAHNLKSSLYSSTMFFKGWVKNLTYSRSAWDKTRPLMERFEGQDGDLLENQFHVSSGCLHIQPVWKGLCIREWRICYTFFFHYVPLT